MWGVSPDQAVLRRCLPWPLPVKACPDLAVLRARLAEGRRGLHWGRNYTIHPGCQVSIHEDEKWQKCWYKIIWITFCFNQLFIWLPGGSIFCFWLFFKELCRKIIAQFLKLWCQSFWKCKLLWFVIVRVVFDCNWILRHLFSQCMFSGLTNHAISGVY